MKQNLNIGVLLVVLLGRIDGNSRFTWWFNHVPGPSISPKRTPMNLNILVLVHPVRPMQTMQPGCLVPSHSLREGCQLGWGT